jgi:beta-phosphoglucomutase
MKASAAPFAVLFDMDGVLIDTEPSHKHAHTIISLRYGFSADDETRAWRSGSTLRHFYEGLQAVRPFERTFDEFADEMLAELFTDLEQRVHGADQTVVRLLERLQAHHIPFAVGTSALKRSAARKLKLVNLHEQFEVVISADDVTRHKPEPDVYIEAAKRLGIIPNKCIVVEDSAHGIRAGHAAGAKVIGYYKHNPDKASLHEADLLTNNYDELSYETLLKLVAGKA